MTNSAEHQNAPYLACEQVNLCMVGARHQSASFRYGWGSQTGIGRSSPRQYSKTFRSANPASPKQHNRFPLARYNGARIRHKVYYETRGFWGVKQVDEASADPGLLGLTPVAVDKDHIGIRKFSSRTDQVYLGVLRFLKVDALAPRLGSSAREFDVVAKLLGAFGDSAKLAQMLAGSPGSQSLDADLAELVRELSKTNETLVNAIGPLGASPTTRRPLPTTFAAFAMGFVPSTTLKASKTNAPIATRSRAFCTV
jgi:hypothetical protein